MKQANITKADKITKLFFESIGGKILYSKCVNIQTYTSQKNKIPCVTYYIIFQNKNILGRGSFSREIYPRYRKIRSDWKDRLTKSGLKLFVDLAVGFIPLLHVDDNKEKVNHTKYKKDKRNPLGMEILDIEKTDSSFYKEMVKEFDVKFALKEGGGMFIGPEKSMLKVLRASCDTLKKINCFIDIGSGTGELSAFVLKNYSPKKVIVNELSQDLKLHLNTYLRKIAKKSKIEVFFNFQDCKKMSFPDNVSLISVGVFYGAQPPFIKYKGPELKKSLGKNGILLIQSSMPEALFNQHILMGDMRSLKRWPWYYQEFVLSKFFSCVKVFFIDNQFITLASQSYVSINRIIKKLGREAIPYSYFKQKQ